MPRFVADNQAGSVLGSLGLYVVIRIFFLSLSNYLCVLLRFR